MIVRTSISTITEETLFTVDTQVLQTITTAYSYWFSIESELLETCCKEMLMLITVPHTQRKVNKCCVLI